MGNASAKYDTVNQEEDRTEVHEDHALIAGWEQAKAELYMYEWGILE